MEEAISPVSYKIGTPGKKGAILLAEEDIEDGQHLELTNPLDQGTEDKPTPNLGQELTTEQEAQLNHLLERYQDFFSDTPGRTSHVTFEINTGDNRPAKVRPYLEGEARGRSRPITQPWHHPP